MINVSNLPTRLCRVHRQSSAFLQAKRIFNRPQPLPSEKICLLVEGRNLLRIELADIDRTRLRSFSFTISSFRVIAVETPIGLWCDRLESADSEGRERELSFDDLAIPIKIEPPV
jgi:hypothetical protein